MRCCVPTCPNSKKRVTDISLFSIPKGESRIHWINSLKIDPESIKNQTRVCIRHFSEDDVFKFSTRTKLKPKRIPTIDIPNPSVVVNKHTIEDNTESILVDTEHHIENTRVATEYNKSKPVKKRLSVFQPKFNRINSKFYIENFKNNDKIFYYSGVQSYKLLLIIFRFVFKSEKGPVGAVHQANTKGKWKKQHKLSSLNEMFLTLMKLRRGFQYETLADMFLISKSAVGRIFISWINLLYTKLADIKIFQHLDILLKHAPHNFLKKYPNVIGSIDCTEFYIETPSSLVCQSQCYSQYKGSNTLKGLIMIDPNGAIIFVSNLYTGSISDKKIVEDSGFLALLKKKVSIKELNEGDIILADKGFEIKQILENIGIHLNIPTFKIAGIQFEPNEVEHIRKIAHERVHVERAIRRLKTFKILSNRIPISLLSCINQIYTVCALLTNCMHPLRK